MSETKYLVIEHLTSKDIRRLFSKIEVDKTTGCWNWIGALNTYGYGEFWYNNRMEVAHRFVYAWVVGPIPQGVASDIPVLDHFACDNPRCCNPAHLRLVTTVENLRRTNSVSAVNRRKTHCKRGHLLPAEVNRPDGKGRRCNICMKECAAKYYQEIARPKQVAERLARRLARPLRPILTEEERKEKKRQYHREYQHKRRMQAKRAE